MKYLFIILLFFLHTLDLSSQVITNYTTSEGLVDNYVECIDIDMNDNVWFGTSLGVQMFDGSNWYLWNQANFPGLLSNNIKCIRALSNGEIWVGTDYGVSKFQYSIPGSNWISYTSSDGLVSNQVKSIDEDPITGIWIGTSQGVSHFDGSSWVSFSSDLHWSGVCGTDFDSNGDKWFVSPLGGVTHYDGNSFTVYDTSSGLLSQNATSIVIDDFDNKWIGTGSGISVLDANNSIASNYTQMYILSPPDTLNPVVNLEIDSDGNIWATIYVGYLAKGGIVRFDSNQWMNFDVSDGVIGENVKGIALDSEDNAWVSTSTGVSKISLFSTHTDDLSFKLPIIFPNPSSDKLFIAENYRSQIDEIIVYDSFGNVVLKEKNDFSNISLSSLSSGVYYLMINSSNKFLIEKLIIN